MYMQEKIGNVILDYTWYPGEDLYSDGAIEERLLEIARTSAPEDLDAAVAAEADWAVLYHLSHVRENITASLQLTKKDSVLEIGAGCGAVTGALAKMAGSVTCVDLSRRRSLVNAWRHKDFDNIQILVGNFQDIEKNLTEKYDCITLIGVFEYAQAYIAGTADGSSTKDVTAPYTAFLKLIRRHLKPGGRLVIAIENRLGLKYWAGCREDHTGNLFEGLENYPVPSGVRTFSRPELEDIFDRAGFPEREFYYPYPDYKLPSVIWSDRYLPSEGDLNTNIYNFDRERLILFDERAVYDSLLKSGQYPLFSNSYLVILTQQEEPDMPDERVIYARCSNERSRSFAVCTRILEDASGSRTVEKEAWYPEGRTHVKDMCSHSRELQQLFEDTNIRVNRAFPMENAVRFEYLQSSRTLEDYLHELCVEGKRDEAEGILHDLCCVLEKKAVSDFTFTRSFAETFGQIDWPAGAKTLPVTDLDMVPENFLMDSPEGTWHLIDYEWTYTFPIPVRFVMYRIWHYFAVRNLEEGAEEQLLQDEGFDRKEIRRYEEMERAWQNSVTGTLVPIRELFARITPGSRDLREEVEYEGRRGSHTWKTAFYYAAQDEEFDEDHKIVCPLVTEADGSFLLDVPLGQMRHPAKVRWDPLDRIACRVRIECAESLYPVAFRAQGGFERDGWTQFWSTDPAFILTGEFPKMESLCIRGKLETVRMMDHLDEMRDAWFERDAAKEELGRVRALLAAQQSTKAFKLIEKARSARNFVMARVRALPPFRDKNALPAAYQEWAEAHRADADTLAGQRISQLPVQPKFSILVPVFRTPEEYLRAMIDSVRNQTYGNWQLCIADASVDDKGARDEKVRSVLEEYAALDSRISVAYLEKNLGISENTNGAARLACGDYIMLLDHDDTLAPEALYEFAAAVARTGADVLYSDEDKMSMDGRSFYDPNLKPDFSPDLLRSHNYITHLFSVRIDRFMEIGGFRSEFDGAQDYDLILRCTEKADRIFHIPKILYHWRMHPGSTAQNPKSKMYAYEAGRKAIDAHLKRVGIPGEAQILDLWGLNRVRVSLQDDPMVSVIIPNKDHREDLDTCIRSIMERSSYRRLEIIVVENNSTQQETFSYYDQIIHEFPQVKVVKWEGPFNYSAINNFGVTFARGKYLLLLNNDTELIEPDSIAEMAGFCQRSDVGCVGAKLLYKDDTVQHAGIILGPGGFAGHVFHGKKKTDYGFMMRLQIAGNYSAVTAACLMVSREKYDEIGGLDESFAVALNDVDFCLRLREKGYLVVFTPFSLWHHYESKSRGYEDTPEKKARFEKEIKHFRERWGTVVDAGDPYYNPNFAKDREPFTLF